MSGFGPSTTAEEVVSTLGTSLSGRNIFITGASSGIGVECARVLANAGANVWLAGRNVSKTEAVAQKIVDECGDSSRVHVIELDLSDLSSVHRCVTEFTSLNVPLHILLNNAGCMAVQEREETKDGHEMQIGTNHLAHFVLTNGLMNSLLNGAPSRIVNVSSMAHRRGGINFEDIMARSSYDPWRAYGQSKTANILHAVELNRLYAKDGVIAVSLHPGVIETELWRHTGAIMKMNKTIPQGAATSVFCCVSPAIQGGRFYNDCNEDQAAPYATDAGQAEQLWSLSLELTK